MNDILKVTVFTSLLFNLGFLGIGILLISKKIPNLWRRLSIALERDYSLQSMQTNPYYLDRVHHFERLPTTGSEIIFLGDSLIDCCEWTEFFDKKLIKNRGICGDRTDGVLERLDKIVASKPKKIFLLIGINDLVLGRTVLTTLSNYKAILKRIQEETPETQVFIQSLLPVNTNKFSRISKQRLDNKKVFELNKELQDLAQKFSIQYIDLLPYFIDEKNELKAHYTTDGIHLNGEAYWVWKEIIEKDVVN